MVNHYTVTLGPYPRGFHLITNEVFAAVKHWPQQAMMTVFMKHTSAGLCINENADADVRHDFDLFFNRLAPEDMNGIRHDMEGSDDMPAHIKSVLSGATVTIPVIDGQAALGTWQGIFLCEFRNRATPRKLIVSIIE
jgi:secondary thiamine-phosphate synthase enzyme